MVLGGVVCGVLFGGRLQFREAAIERGRGVKREHRKPTRRELEAVTSRRPGGMIICSDCVDAVGDFMEAAYDARARRKEWAED